MILDTSAVLAILRREADGADFAEAIGRSVENMQPLRISAANFLEAAMVADGTRNVIASRDFDEMIDSLPLAIEPVTEKQARLAREAFRDFGKRSGHPARLNFGDCFAYALAKDKGEPLLFKGNDFIHTDVKRA